MNTTLKPRKAARPRPRCTHCGERLDDTNTPMRFEVYFGTGFPAHVVHGCRWCAGLDDYES